MQRPLTVKHSVTDATQLAWCKAALTLQTCEPCPVVMQANEAVDEDLQHLHEEKHSEGEDKQAETVNLGHRLTASIEQVSTVHRASAQDSHTNEIQVCIAHACL